MPTVTDAHLPQILAQSIGDATPCGHSGHENLYVDRYAGADGIPYPTTDGVCTDEVYIALERRTTESIQEAWKSFFFHAMPPQKI